MTYVCGMLVVVEGIVTPLLRDCQHPSPWLRDCQYLTSSLRGAHQMQDRLNYFIIIHGKHLHSSALNCNEKGLHLDMLY